MKFFKRRDNPEEGDTIVHAFRPLAILAKIMGLFPCKNICNGPYGREWITVFIFPVLTGLKYGYMMVKRKEFLREIFLNFSNTSTYIRNLRYYNQLFSACSYYLLYQINFKEMCDVVKRLNKFDAKIRSNVNTRLKTWNVYLTLVGLMYTASYNTAYYVCMRFHTEGADYQLYFLTMLYANMFNLIPTLHVLFFTEAVCKRLAMLNSHIMDVVYYLPKTFSGTRLRRFSHMSQHKFILASPFRQDDRTSLTSLVDSAASDDLPDDVDLSDTLSEFCGAFDELTEIVEEVSSAFGSTVAVTYLSLVFNVVAGSGYLLLGINHEWEFSYSMLIYVEGTICFVLLVLMTDMLARVSNKSTAILPKLCRIKLLALSSECQAQLQMLIHRMASHTARITAASFFPISRSILTSIAGAVFTYLIILAQFKASETTLAASNNKSN